MKLILLVLFITTIHTGSVLSQGRLFEEIDSTKTYEGSVVLHDYSNRSSKKITILKDRILVNNYLGAKPEVIPIEKVKIVRFETGNYLFEGAGLGFLLGFSISLNALIDDEIDSDTKLNAFLIISSITTVAGGIVGALSPKIKSYLIRNYYDFGLNINHTYIDKCLDLSQVSVGIYMQL